MNEPLAVNQPVIKVEQLTRIYRRGEHEVRALDGVDVTIEPGEFVMVVGSSGSGKSTLMNILGGLDRPTSGNYELAGLSIADFDDTQMAHLRGHKIGFVFQQFHLLPHLTVAENIALPLSYCGIEHDERVERAYGIAERFGVENRLCHRPQELRGGLAQRVAMMRALVNNPAVLMHDEPTGALDSKTGREIMDIFHDLNKAGLTIVMVTHDPVLAEEGTRKIVMKDGLIVDDRPGKRSRPSHTKSVLEGDGGIPDDGGLGVPDLMRIGFREGLLTHKMRSALTMLGIIIGVAAVISMSSFSLGSKRKQEMQIRELGANQVNIVDTRLEGDALNEARQRGSRGLNRDDMIAIRDAVADVSLLSANRSLDVRVHIDEEPVLSNVIAVTGDYMQITILI